MVSRILGFGLFFLVFFIIYFGAHLYIFLRLGNFLQIKKTFWFYLTLIILALSFPLMNFITRTINNSLSRTLYSISAVWFGALFLLLCSLLIYEIIRLFVKTNSKIAGIVILIFVAIIVIYAIINALFITTKYVEIPMPNLDKELTIVQLSDLHLGTIHNSKYLQNIVDKTNTLNPNIVMITGDLADGGGVLTDETFSPLNNIKAKTFFTIGNHDQMDGLDKILGLLNKTKVQVLRNELTEYDGIQIIGIDNPEGFQKQNNALDSIKINRTKPSVLMYHPPFNIDKANSLGINLQLSGHTHNGQIMPFNYLERLVFSKYMSGLYNYNGTYLYVSSGTGTWGPPLRLGTRSEISVIKLVKK